MENNIEQKDKLLECIPSSLREYARDRACLITDDATEVNRNVERLAAEHPEIHDKIEDYRKRVKGYIGGLHQGIEDLYDVASTNRPGAEVGRQLAINVICISLYESLFNCLVQEMTITESLEKVNLEPARFGFLKSTIALLGEMQECMNAMTWHRTKDE